MLSQQLKSPGSKFVIAPILFGFFVLCAVVLSASSTAAEGWRKENYICPSLGRKMTRTEAMEAFRFGLLDSSYNRGAKLPALGELLAKDPDCCPDYVRRISRLVPLC